MIVVDTNVMVGLLVDEEVTSRASHVLAFDREWSAPPILPIEFRNALLRYVRRGDFTPERAKAMASDAAAILGNRIYDMPGDAVIDAALECGLTAYDAEFVALARALGVTLVTMDAAVLRGAADMAVPLEAFAP